MTIETLKKCRAEAQRLWLGGWYVLMDEANALRECNGCGAEWMPRWMRRFLSWLLKLFAAAFAIHDMRYWRNEGDRHEWDDEFETNCRAIARDKYTWYHPMRYICYWVARRLRVALTIGGELAWKEAGKRFTEET